MKSRKEIEKGIKGLNDICYKAGRQSNYDDVIVELLLDTREVLIKLEKKIK